MPTPIIIILWIVVTVILCRISHMDGVTIGRHEVEVEAVSIGYATFSHTDPPVFEFRWKDLTIGDIQDE